jgi:hypothetical protein
MNFSPKIFTSKHALRVQKHAFLETAMNGPQELKKRIYPIVQAAAAADDEATALFSYPTRGGKFCTVSPPSSVALLIFSAKNYSKID